MLQEKANAEELYDDAFGKLSSDTLMTMAIAAPYPKGIGLTEEQRILTAFKNLVVRREEVRKVARILFLPRTATE